MVVQSAYPRPSSPSQVLDMGLSILIKLFTIAFVVPIFGIAGLVIGAVGGFIAELCVSFCDPHSPVRLADIPRMFFLAGTSTPR
jgi:hypothetical protein